MNDKKEEQEITPEAQAIVDDMEKQFNDHDQLSLILEGFIGTSDGKYTPEMKEAHLQQGRELIKKLRPMMLNVARVVSNPETRDQLLDGLSNVRTPYAEEVIEREEQAEKTSKVKKEE